MENKAFMTIKDASTATGLSQIYIRNGCRDGTIPHIRIGIKYLVNVPRLIQKLDAESEVSNG